MDAENKHYETGSNPYYLNLNNTAKEFMTEQDSTSPEYGFMNILNDHVLIEQPLQIVENVEENKEEDTVPDRVDGSAHD